MGQSITDPEETGLTTVIPARVRPIADRAVDLLTDDADAADNDRFYFTAEISSTSLDSYFTHMDPSTLRNFARDAATGVSLLDSHDSYKLGIGYSAAGRYEEEGETGRVHRRLHIVPGIRSAASTVCQHRRFHSSDTGRGGARRVSRLLRRPMDLRSVPPALFRPWHSVPAYRRLRVRDRGRRQDDSSAMHRGYPRREFV
ncbi:MAG: hypothetical protein M9896_13810 [Candidatus Promineofilum sp.]|uniref:hypothetical protein n=1 Tax=Promineifilum sp. TaxID=2664178 RepID=UPI002411DEFC|nr:hypothetical protein [Promineifilum sp.]